MTDNPVPTPQFAEKIVEKYLSSQSTAFVIYGNTKDIYPVDGGKRYAPLIDFLIESLIRPNKPSSPKTVLIYDPAEGITFHNPVDREDISARIGEERLSKILAASRSDIVTALDSMRQMMKLTEKTSSPLKHSIKPLAVIIRHGEAVAPVEQFSSMADSDRLKVITLENWLSEDSFVISNNIVFLITETLGGINSRIVELPYVSAINIERPSEGERQSFLLSLARSADAIDEADIEQLTFSSAGLSLLSIRQIVNHAAYRGLRVSPSHIFEKAREIIEKELEGYISFLELDYGFESVLGCRTLIDRLNELKTFLNGSDPELMPVGILVPGPNGVGKTFIMKAFARECEWIAVELKNVRGQYVGQTESNWERIRSALEAMGKVMVFYDEADTEIGGRGPQSHEVDRRLFGAMLKMMSDRKNRGRIVWIIITARPDRLEPDIKRSGRAGEHIPVFDIHGSERDGYVRSQFLRAGIDIDLLDLQMKEQILKITEKHYPADFDHLITELRRRKYLDGEIGPETIMKESANFMPPDISGQREFQELIAVLECTSRKLLPEKYANLPREFIEKQLEELKASMRILA